MNKKGILEYNLEDVEAERDFEIALKSVSTILAIEEVGNEIFRPARKHGYGDREIQELLDRIGDDGVELISLLETKFYEILQSYKVPL